jgi:UDP-glucose 4-epimerase
VDAFLLVATSPQVAGRVYSPGGAQVIDLKSLAEVLIKQNGRGEYVIRDFPAERQSIDIGDHYADFFRIRQELGWTPQDSLCDTIARTLAFYRDHLAC